EGPFCIAKRTPRTDSHAGFLIGERLILTTSLLRPQPCCPSPRGPRRPAARARRGARWLPLAEAKPRGFVHPETGASSLSVCSFLRRSMRLLVLINAS